MTTRTRIDDSTFTITHERKEILHHCTWSGGERICYVQRVDLEVNGRLIRADEVQFWYLPDGTLTRVTSQPLITLGPPSGVTCLITRDEPARTARDARIALDDAVPSWMHGLPLEMD